MDRIELLESRIAPASLTGRILSYTDVDGDKVTVAFSKGTLSEANFVFNNPFETTGPQQLQRINVSSVSDIDGSDVIVKVTPVVGGDGVAHIGEIVATGHDLGVVKTKGDLARVDAGNPTASVPAIKLLSIGSFGAFDGTTQPAGAFPTGLVLGDIPTVKIKGDVTNGALNIAGAVRTLSVGGSIIGTNGNSEGRLIVENVARATIGGSIAGGTGRLSGNLSIIENAGSVVIGGSIIGGAPVEEPSFAQVYVGGAINKLVVLGEVRGVSGDQPQSAITIDGAVGSVLIGGDVTALDGKLVAIDLADQVSVPGVAVKSVVIKGSVQNFLLSVGSNNGTPGPVTVESISIDGAFTRGNIAIGAGAGADMVLGTPDDVINGGSRLNSLVIKGPAFGTRGGVDSFIIEAGRIESVRIGGRIIAVAPGDDTIAVAPGSDIFVKDLG